MKTISSALFRYCLLYFEVTNAMSSNNFWFWI